LRAFELSEEFGNKEVIKVIDFPGKVIEQLPMAEEEPEPEMTAKKDKKK
jgi:5-methylcytosine-specific restriction endonuclease McrBC regulatory subunit McrC